MLQSFVIVFPSALNHLALLQIVLCPHSVLYLSLFPSTTSSTLPNTSSLQASLYFSLPLPITLNLTTSKPQPHNIATSISQYCIKPCNLKYHRASQSIIEPHRAFHAQIQTTHYLLFGCFPQADHFLYHKASSCLPYVQWCILLYVLAYRAITSASI